MSLPVSSDYQVSLDGRIARPALSSLKKNEYTEEGLAQVMGAMPARYLNAHEYEMALERTRHLRPLDVLVRLFLLHAAVENASARRSLGAKMLRSLEDANLIRRSATSVTGAFKLTPLKDWILASDFQAFEGKKQKVRGDFVMGISASTRFLATLTVRRPVATTLDLGTGCGTLAFLASQHSQQVTAADLNGRAVRLAAFNAWLNGAKSFRYAQGDLFAPVSGQRFGLIVSSPPYVISPETRYLFRDGAGGSNICRRLVQGAPEHMEEGGYCQFLCNFPHHGDDGTANLKSWFKRCGCDAWIMRVFTQDVAEYGAEWLRSFEPDSPAHVAGHYKRWMDFYRSEGISAISGALVNMRKTSSSKNWLSIDAAPQAWGEESGEQVACLMENRTALPGLSDAELLNQAWQTSPSLVADQHVPIASVNGRNAVELRWLNGLDYREECRRDLAGVLARCNGKTPLLHLLRDAPRSLRTDSKFLSASLKRLAARGLIRPGR